MSSSVLKTEIHRTKQGKLRSPGHLSIVRKLKNHGEGLMNRPYTGHDAGMSLCRGLLKPGRRAGLLPPCRSSRSQDSTGVSPCDPDGLHTTPRAVLCWMGASAHT